MAEETREKSSFASDYEKIVSAYSTERFAYVKLARTVLPALKELYEHRIVVTASNEEDFLRGLSRIIADLERMNEKFQRIDAHPGEYGIGHRVEDATALLTLGARLKGAYGPILSLASFITEIYDGGGNIDYAERTLSDDEYLHLHRALNEDDATSAKIFTGNIGSLKESDKATVQRMAKDLGFHSLTEFAAHMKRNAPKVVEFGKRKEDYLVIPLFLAKNEDVRGHAVQVKNRKKQEDIQLYGTFADRAVALPLAPRELIMIIQEEWYAQELGRLKE